MILKTVGFYAFLLAILNSFLFILLMQGIGVRPFYYLMLFITILGIPASIIGLLNDKNKVYSAISIIIFFVLPIIIWILQE